MRSQGPEKAASVAGNSVLLIFALGWCCVLALIDRELGHKVWLQAKSSAYIGGQATMLKSELSSVRGRKGRSTHGVEMLYSYELDGRKFTSDRYAFQAARSSDSAWAHAAVAKYPKGATVPIFYDPKQPEFSVIRKGLDGSDIFTLIFLTPFHLIGLALLMFVSTPVRALFRRNSDAICEPGGRERIFVGEWQPTTAFLATFGFASFIGIFIIAIPFGFHPPMWMALTVWGAGFLWALQLALSTRRKIHAGECDLVVDRHSALLSLPAMHGRLSREEVRFAEIAKVEAREVYEIPNRRINRKSRKVTEVILRTKSGAELLLKKPWSLTEAQRWAQWLQGKMAM